MTRVAIIVLLPAFLAGCDAACAIDGSPLLRGSGVVFTSEP